MPRNQDPSHEVAAELLAEQVELLPLNRPVQPQEGEELTQAQLLARIAERRVHEAVVIREENRSRSSRRALFRGLGRAAASRHRDTPQEPEPEPDTPSHPFPRRRFNRGVIFGSVALWLSGQAGIWAIEHWKELGHLIHQGDETRRVLSFKDRFDRKMRALPSDNALKERVPRLGATINLDDFRRERHLDGPINFRILSVGTSNSFALGTDDLNHPTEQRHSVPYRAAQALKTAARRLLGIGDIKTLVLARPGAYSGYQFPGITDEEQPRDGVLEQLSDPRVRAFLLAEGSAGDLIIVRYECGQDDLRLLADNIDHIQKLLANLHAALLNDETVDEDIEREFNQFQTKLDELATQFCQNMQAAGDIIAKLNEERVARGWSPIHFEPVYSWSLLEQARIPFGLLKPRADNAPLPSWLQPDHTDPRFLRYFIEVDAIDEGPNLARWAWVTLTQAQIAAQTAIQAKYPELRVIPEWLVGLNTGRLKDIFYAAVVDGQVDPKGDGHPGLIENDISGIDFISAAMMRLWEQRLLEEGLVSAAEYAEFPGQQPKRLAA